MILFNAKSSTIAASTKEGHVVWYKLHNILIVNTPINNAQDLSALMITVLGIKYSPLTNIQDL